MTVHPYIFTQLDSCLSCESLRHDARLNYAWQVRAEPLLSAALRYAWAFEHGEGEGVALKRLRERAIAYANDGKVAPKKRTKRKG